VRRNKFLRLWATFAFATFAIAIWAHGQSPSRNWQTGTLVETEQTKVRSGSTRNSTSDGGSTNSTITENYDTYQNYTIDGGNKIYVASEHLLFPWSKPASASVGEKVKFAVEKGKLYLAGDDGKEHKANIVKTSLKTAP
jgi:hypothetical protein